jgi:DNA-binding transcriptional MerR regulator
MGILDTSLTIEQLAACVAQALSSGSPDELNGRIRAIPDVRTLRYYTTLGLLDRPAHMRGRTALYRRRHVLQLVAIKRLQAKGLSLADIQARLLGASDAELAKLARVPSGFSCQTTTSTSGSNAQKPSRSPDPSSPTFWKARPAPSATPPEEVAATLVAMPAFDRPPAGEQSPPVVDDGAAPVPLLVGVPLAPEVSLLLPAHRELDEVDRDAIRAAAQPLLKLLLQRRILPQKN